MKWWEGFLTEKQDINYVSFKIKDSEVLIGPRMITYGTDPTFFKSIDGFLVVTETYIEYPPESNVRWFPWLEGTKEFPEEVLFGGLKTLNNWINELSLKKIYIHCDLGSHRAPSILGAFLKAYFTDDDAQSIIQNADISHATTYYWKFDQLMNNPLKYIETKFKLVPTLPFLIKAIVANPQSDLSTILSRDLINLLPDNLVSKDELKERIKKRNRLKLIILAKEYLETNGYIRVGQPPLYPAFDSEFVLIKNEKEYHFNIVNYPEEKVFQPNISVALKDGHSLFIIYPNIKKMILKYHNKKIIKTKTNNITDQLNIMEICLK